MGGPIPERLRASRPDVQCLTDVSAFQLAKGLPLRIMMDNDGPRRAVLVADLRPRLHSDGHSRHHTACDAFITRAFCTQVVGIDKEHVKILKFSEKVC